MLPLQFFTDMHECSLNASLKYSDLARNGLSFMHLCGPSPPPPQRITAKNISGYALFTLAPNTCRAVNGPFR